MNNTCFSDKPVFTNLIDEKGEIIECFWLAAGCLFREEDENCAWEKLRINRKCNCGELTNNKNKLLCPTCIEKQELEEYKNMPIEDATEILYSLTQDTYMALDSVQEFLDNEDEVRKLQLVNTETESLNLVRKVEDIVSDYLYNNDGIDDISLPASLIEELERFSIEIPKQYYKTKIKPNLSDIIRK